MSSQIHFIIIEIKIYIVTSIYIIPIDKGIRDCFCIQDETQRVRLREQSSIYGRATFGIGEDQHVTPTLSVIRELNNSSDSIYLYLT